MEFTSEFSSALLEHWGAAHTNISLWDFGSMYCMGGQL